MNTTTRHSLLRLPRRLPPLAAALVLLAGLALTACDHDYGIRVTGPGDHVIGSGNLVTEAVVVSGFDGVTLRGVGLVTVEQGGSESLRVTTDDNILQHLITEVVGGRLVLEVAPDVNISPSQILYEVTVRDLREMSVSGAGDVQLHGIHTDFLSVALSGAGHISASGSARHQQITISGAGRYQAPDLDSRVAEIRVSGAGAAMIRVSDRLDAVVSGTGTIEYFGDPQVTTSISGTGVVRRLGP